MFDNIRNTFTNRNFQFGLGAFITLVALVWFFNSNPGDETLTTEEASTTTETVEVTEHDQTPTTESQNETEQVEEDVNEKVDDNSSDSQ